VWALLLPNKTLRHAFIAERVTTDSRSTRYDKVHADRTCQAVNLAHRFLHRYKEFTQLLELTFLQLVEFLLSLLYNLVLGQV